MQTDQNGLAERLIRGIGAGLIGHAISLVARLALPPVFLSSWGPEAYGEWLILTAFAAHLVLSDLGAGVYIVNRMAHAFALKDSHLFRSTLQTGLALFLLWPAAVFALFAAAIWAVPLRDVLGIQEMDNAVVAVVVLVLALQVVISLPQAILLGVYRAVGQLHRGVMFANALQLLQLVAVSLALMWHRGPVMVSILQAGPHLIIGLVAAWDLNRRFPELQVLSVREANVQTAREFVRPSLHFLSIVISSALSIQGVVLVAGLVLGPVQAVAFVTVRTLCNAMKSMLSLVSQTAWPELTRLDAQGDIGTLHALFRAVLRSSMVAATFIAFLLHSYGKEIYQVWLMGSVSYPAHVMDLFLIFLLQQVFWNTSGSLLMAANVHYGLSRVALASAVLAIILSLVGVRIGGLEGLVIGMMMGEVLLPLWLVPFLVGRFRAVFSTTFFVRELVPVFVAIALMILGAAGTVIAVMMLLVWWWPAARLVLSRTPGKTS